MPDLPLDILVLGAHGPDLRGLRVHLGEHLVGTLHGLHVAAKTIGIGLPVAGASAAKRAFQLQPRAVIHLGTCGIYPGLDQYKPCDVIVSSRVDLVDPSVAMGRSEYPDPMQTELTPDTMLTAGLAKSGGRCRAGPVASSLARTTDDEVAAEIPGRFNVHCECLEAFSVAHACHLAQVPFTCVLAATHVVGSHARDDWQQFERQATIAAAEVFITWLVNGARGMPHP